MCIRDRIYTALPGAEETLMLQSWPVYEPEMEYAREEADFQQVMDLIKAVRAAVSYTHLDVYKRQVLFHKGFRQPRPGGAGCGGGPDRRRPAGGP